MILVSKEILITIKLVFNVIFPVITMYCPVIDFTYRSLFMGLFFQYNPVFSVFASVFCKQGWIL